MLDMEYYFPRKGFLVGFFKKIFLPLIMLLFIFIGCGQSSSNDTTVDIRQNTATFYDYNATNDLFDKLYVILEMNVSNASEKPGFEQKVREELSSIGYFVVEQHLDVQYDTDLEKLILNVPKPSLGIRTCDKIYFCFIKWFGNSVTMHPSSINEWTDGEYTYALDFESAEILKDYFFIRVKFNLNYETIGLDGVYHEILGVTSKDIRANYISFDIINKLTNEVYYNSEKLSNIIVEPPIQVQQ